MNIIKQYIEESISYLTKSESIDSINIDPYWPKWNSPWWHILLLYEIGEIKSVPQPVMDSLVNAINRHYLKFFPLYENEIPAGKDPYRNIACHCQLGCAYQFLNTYYDDIDSLIPWIVPWFLKYQLPDGGLNCDEAAYTNSQKSSIVSTLPPLEAILMRAEKGLTEEEKDFLDKGAKYLIKHRLAYKTNGTIMDESFFQLQFPRFYSYDILRGLTFLVNWRKIRNKDDADEIIEFGYNLIKKKLSNNMLKIERSDFKNEQTLMLSESGNWIWQQASTFPLLDYLDELGKDSVFLSNIFRKLK